MTDETTTQRPQAVPRWAVIAWALFMIAHAVAALW